MPVSPKIIKKHEEMFYPTVRVRAKGSGGSGTVVYSEKHGDECHTYVITNHHVVSRCIKVEKRWNPVKKKKMDTEILDTVYVEYFKYNNYSHCIGSFAIEADIVAYSEVEGGQDWALLRVRDKETPAPYVANLFPETDIENIHIFDPCYAVGASLGHAPIATNGHICYMDDEISHYRYWMSTAQTIFGNSGGALYRYSDERKEYEYIGIPSRITVQPMGFSSDPITHMGYFIPIERVYNLLRDNDYHFIFDDTMTFEECAKRRGEEVPDDDLGEESDETEEE